MAAFLHSLPSLPRFVFLAGLNLLEDWPLLRVDILRSQLYDWFRLTLLLLLHHLPAFIHFLLLLRIEVVVLDLLCRDAFFIWLFPFVLLLCLLLFALVHATLHDHFPGRPVLVDFVDRTSVAAILSNRLLLGVFSFILAVSGVLFVLRGLLVVFLLR